MEKPIVTLTNCLFRAEHEKKVRKEVVRKVI
jgi:hypothetical protein